MNLRRNLRGWLFWLALLLPIAQAMAGAHALSHIGEGADEGLSQLLHCDLCLTAANLGAGAPATEPAAVPASPAVHAAPLLARGSAPRAVSLGLPPARAPPTSV
ncbi:MULTISPECIES: hypothetical protein [unclassified Roseateles]|uniref:hypothetical protein n=1 Tax=unclassified Roseateles TaxID=2626991 RepID=UPI0006F97A92|nr:MULTISPECIES: hypothetical protein [unclassified Roseateles]KQW51525.1 hypothetical protein ASC81_02485 [Pelomonas sp. Root405]KRA77758.1 hypothetical protein ASD88_02485 [Pelomonas sp. Root662]